MAHRRTYRVGEIINIGYYVGFRHQIFVKTQAEILKVSGNWIKMRVRLSSGGHKTMFGYDHELIEMEANYNKQ